MKKGLSVLLVLLISLTSIVAHAQNSVTYCNDVNKAAEKFAKKVKKKHIKLANENYPKALAAIEKAKLEYPKEEFGYDKLVAQVPSWIRMYKSLAALGTNKVVDKKDNSFEFVVVDYQSLLDESKIKAGEAHFNAGKTLMSSEDFKEVKEGFSHFDKAKKYVDTYNTQIDELMVERYYQEGVKILNSSEEYSERVKSVTYFKSALKINSTYKDSKTLMLELYYNEGVKVLNSSSVYSEKVKSIKYFKLALNIENPYKDINELIAELYYVEGEKLIEKEETTVTLKNAVDFYKESLKYIPNYKDCNEKITQTLNAGAELVYNQAVELENEESFEGQKKAYESFKSVDEWVKGYKDADSRAAVAKSRSSVTVVLIADNGKVLDSKHRMLMNSKLKSYIRVNGNINELSDLDLNKEENFPKATELTNKRFVLVKFGENEDAEFTDNGPIEKVTEVFEYSSQKKGEEEKFVSEEELNRLKKVAEIGGGAEKLGYTFRTYSGVVTTITESVSYKTSYIVEVVDARNPDSPFQIGKIKISKSFSDSRVNRTYTGDEKAKPSNITSDTHTLLTEVQLKAKADAQDVSLDALLAEDTLVAKRYMDIVNILNKNIEYVSY